MFVKATKKRAKLRIALEGIAGSGKTYSSLKLATKLLDKTEGNGRIALVDSEHGSASLYAHLFDFDAVELDEFSLTTYLRAIDAAKGAGYPVLVIDSLSHAWAGKGGALEQVDRMGGSKFTNGWKHVTPLQTQLINTMLAYPGHVIATLRTKSDYSLEKDEHTGKIAPKKVGMAPIQREGVDYEFSVVLDLQQGGLMTVSKSRCDALPPGTVLKWDEIDTAAAKLISWLSMGAELSQRDLMLQAIRGASSHDALMALVPQMKGLEDEDREALRGPWQKREQEFVG